MTRLEDLPHRKLNVFLHKSHKKLVGQFDKKIALETQRYVVLLKLNYRKNPARFEEKLTIFLIFFFTLQYLLKTVDIWSARV